MTNPIIRLKVGSRKPFDEESRVVGTAHEAACEVAAKRGNQRGLPLFKVTSRMTVVPAAHDQAVELARNAIESKTLQGGRVLTVRLDGTNTVRLHNEKAAKRLFDDLSSADPGAVEALRRIGLVPRG